MLIRPRGRYLCQSIGRVSADQKRVAQLGEPSCGKPQPGYRLLRSRVRIPRDHSLVSGVDASHSDYFEGVFPGDFSFVVLFA